MRVISTWVKKIYKQHYFRLFIRSIQISDEFRDFLVGESAYNQLLTTFANVNNAFEFLNDSKQTLVRYTANATLNIYLFWRKIF